jgi:histidyl-tRNA synthetase
VSNTLQAIRGMNDILPDEAERWEPSRPPCSDWLPATATATIRMPLVEQTALFRRAIGEVTDIVEKEMYSLEGRAERRGAHAAPRGHRLLRACGIEHSLVYDGPKRLWYAGPMYRHERPQKGRYRQFHQYGVEALGFAGPDVDAELIVMCAALVERIWV